jgi:hypothetical protein
MIHFFAYLREMERANRGGFDERIENREQRTENRES